jgi:hypothetical protein
VNAKGPHTSALTPDAIDQIQTEARENEMQGVAKINEWDNLCKNPPVTLKLSLIVMIPHKLRTYRAILDLSYVLSADGHNLPLINDITRRITAKDSFNQINIMLPCIIKATKTVPIKGGDIMFSKLDIADGVWHITTLK